MKYIRDLKNVERKHAKHAGGKAYSLAKMKKAGFPVPPGFVITSHAFNRFLLFIFASDDTWRTWRGISATDAAVVQERILHSPMPSDIEAEIMKGHEKLGARHVAVRSSALSEDRREVSWAGQFQTFLNTTEKILIENIKRCWASIFAPHVTHYRDAKDDQRKLPTMAVVVQQMVQSKYAGVAFSVHPVTENRDHILIEAVFGLGESLVSGKVTPDSYLVEKHTGKILSKNIAVQKKALYRTPGGGNKWKKLNLRDGRKRVLSDVQIIELADLAARIEKHFGFPCDIEWAYEKGKFYITQSRPITTLKKS